MAATRQISIVTDSFPALPGLDTTLARALLQSVSAGSTGETFRIYSPGRVLAFGKRDTVTRGFPAAAAAARDRGYVPLVRLAGGRAAVFHDGTLAFGWTMPIDDPRSGIQERFEVLSGLMVRAFARLGVESAVGEIPGEYCPGRFSVHHSDNRKVMGVGQRLAQDAAHVGGVIVVTGTDLINEVLDPVYGALGIEFEPSATGALTDLLPAMTITEVAQAIVAELALVGEISSATLPSEIVHRGRDMLSDHLVDVAGLDDLPNDGE